MYERFSDRARKVMQFANQEAQRFNHEFVGSEHILIALCKEGSGIAAVVLKNLGIDLRKLRAATGILVKEGPDMITMGKLPHAPSAKKTVERAIFNAKELNHNYVGTEHILLGLLDVTEGTAAKVLAEFKITSEQIKSDLALLLKSGEKRICQVDLTDILAEYVEKTKTGPLAPDAMRVLIETAAQRGWIQGRDEMKQYQLTASWGMMISPEIESMIERIAALEKEIQNRG
jgi:ATP-dependent Clp protease ATP-binding subunit ClpC